MPHDGAGRVDDGAEASGGPPSYRLIDLFAGAGGMTEGFVRLSGRNFRAVWANDADEHAVKTYNANFGDHCVRGDINALLADPATVIPPADVVIGGPPCQGFSLLNRKREGDPRKELWRPFLEVVERSGADIFVMENVVQLLGTEEFAAISAEAEGRGFRIEPKVLNAADYGVPQRRQRAFIVGSRTVDPQGRLPPPRTHYRPGKCAPQSTLFERPANAGAPLERWATVRAAIGDLPPPIGVEIRDEEAPLDLHFGRYATPLSIRRYEAIPDGGMNWRDLQRLAPELTPPCWQKKRSGGSDQFRRLKWDEPAYTIRTEFFKPEKGCYLHPQQHRALTHREAARLQSFPDDFRFCGTKSAIARQIGNAVPPLLAARVADVVWRLLTVREMERCPTPLLASSAAK